MSAHSAVAGAAFPAGAVRAPGGRTPPPAGRLRAERAALASYAAFREGRYEPYLQFAALCLGRSGPAQAAVTAAFTELAVAWTAILGSAAPAAVAWRILHDHIDRARGVQPAGRNGGPTVRELRDDVQVLSRQMYLSCERIAEVTGVPPEQVSGLLLRASLE
ncbi:hypothetical protein SAMN06272735_8905 [Streptomyces sp. TLI_55]|uniref:hypothetical protein n=1 Tax=Streptomyces sp. TLI_55 TaxID=1938861 RepID=UPI000BCDF8EC|nr:hypothetical protein [Streptomyces sp. TLI_55]SNX88455.1 hypothetical protein SAMN06272735_8905 [Streptomyces sp. TLI_55]